jgi:hypothetical protein
MTLTIKAKEAIKTALAMTITYPLVFVSLRLPVFAQRRHAVWRWPCTL